MLLALYAWTLAPSITELHDNVDSAELVTVASVSGVAHPPGAAIWLPLGRGAIETWTFLDEPAARTNLLSALCMAAAGAVVALATTRWRPGTPGWAAALAGILAGVSPITWAQGIVTEVLALQALLTALALWLAPASGRGWPWFALVLGLLAWNHPTGLAIAMPLGLACLSITRPARSSGLLALAALALPGLFSVAYMWIRADASIAWGATDSVTGLWAHLTGEVYRDVIERSPVAVASAIPETLRRTLTQLPPPAWLLVVPGAVTLAGQRPRLTTALAAACVILVVFVSAYRATGRQDYLAPVVFIAAMAAAYGADEAWQWLRIRLRTQPTVLAAALGLWALVAAWVVVVGDEVDRRGDTTLRDAAVARLQAAEPGAHIETTDDADTFPLWYAQVILGERPDVTIEDVRGLAPVIGGSAVQER